MSGNKGCSTQLSQKTYPIRAYIGYVGETIK